MDKKIQKMYKVIIWKASLINQLLGTEYLKTWISLERTNNKTKTDLYQDILIIL